MTDPIEHGVIPKSCERILLPASYQHPIDDILMPDVSVYIHYSNIKYAPKGQLFYVWVDNDSTDVAIPKDLIVGFKGFLGEYFGTRRIECIRCKSPDPCSAAKPTELHG